MLGMVTLEVLQRLQFPLIRDISSVLELKELFSAGTLLKASSMQLKTEDKFKH